MLRKLKRFRDAANFMREAEQREFDALGISRCAGRIDDERGFVVSRRLEGRGIPLRLRKLLGRKQKEFHARATGLLGILSVTEDETAGRVSTQSLYRTFRQRGCERYDDAPDSQDSEQGKHPMGHVLHENPHAVAATDAPGFKTGGNAVRQPENVGISEFLDTIRVIENECGAARPALSPVLNTIEDPAAGNRRIRWGT